MRIYRNFFLFVVTIVFLMMTLWLIDVSISAMNSEARMYSLLFSDVDPIMTYHIGLILNICVGICSISYFYLKSSEMGK